MGHTPTGDYRECDHHHFLWLHRYAAATVANQYMDATKLGHQTVDVGVGRAITTFLDPTVGLDVCVEATVLMIIAGTLAGFVPARRAANVQPIEALRAE